MESFDETVGEIEEYEDLIANDLKEKLKELKRDGDSKISLASEKRQLGFTFSLFNVFNHN